jgi:hypothetical protein
MAEQAVIDIINSSFGTPVDPDSEGGRILSAITVDVDVSLGQSVTGRVANLTLVPGAGGLHVRAATAGDALVLSLPAIERQLVVTKPGDGATAVRVEITLVAPTLVLPLLRPATDPVDGMLADPGGGEVTAKLPNVLLVVLVPQGSADATANLAPAHDAGGALEVTFEPEYSFFGPDTVLGLGLPSTSVNFDAPAGLMVRFAQVMLFVNPPGMPALAMSGGGTGLVLEIGNGNGLSGELSVHAQGNPASRPDFLESLAARASFLHNHLAVIELTGKAKLSEAVSKWLGTDISPGPSSIDYTLRLALDSGWTASLKLRASDPAGQDFLWRSGGDAQSTPRDIMGAYAVFAPLLAGSLPGAGSSGYVDLGLGGGLATGLASSGWVTTQQLTVLGADLVVKAPPGSVPEGVLFFDVEVVFNLDVHLGETSLIKSRHPLKVRQKAVGLKLDFGNGGNTLKPVFDPLQGFALDLSDPGTFEVADPLGEFLQPDGTRMARDNPLVLEVDIVTKADLGLVSIDRATVRVPIDGGGSPSLTGLGAHLHLGMIEGGGYLKLLPQGGVDGGFDASLAPPLGLRVSGTLHIETGHPRAPDPGLLQLLVALGVEWPIPIPLANSGLGIFGFLGLLASNRVRNQSNGQSALDWLRAAGGDPARGAWIGERGAFALGLGTVIGTLEGGFLLSAKGILMIELPGPRLLLMMKAKIMMPRPPVGDDSEGLLLAVIELSPDAISIGLVFEYGMPFLLQLRAPVETGFDFHHPEHWYLDAGSVEKSDFISVRFMSTIRADGYFMIHGDGIKSPLHPLQGLSVAAGIHAALTWGPVPIGLYIKVGVEADVGISFKPIFMIGKLSLEGELHLFIVNIGVSTAALLRITESSFYVKAEVHGHVDFFFFDVSGGVTFELGDANLPLPAADPLIRALSLHSRSTTQLLPGQAADAPVDASLGEAAVSGSEPTLIVPIDAIPVLQFEMRPNVHDGVAFFNTPIASLLPATDWVRRGERFYRYEMTGVTLSSSTPGAALQDGDTPAVWWDRMGNPPSADATAVQLALLNWIPDPTPVAALRTDNRDQQIVDKWGTVCDDVAPETGVLWTFIGEADGRSPDGWVLEGLPFPDDAGLVRSSPPYTVMKVTECWRSGQLTDAFLKVLPGYVYARDGQTPRYLLAPKTGQKLAAVLVGNDFVDRLLADQPPADIMELADAVRVETAGVIEIRGLVVCYPEAGYVLVRGLDTAGKVQFERPVDNGTATPSQFGDRWKKNPWKPTIASLIQFASDDPRAYFDFKMPEGIVAVDIGFVYTNKDLENLPRQNWGLLAVEIVTAAERARHDWDENWQNTRRKIIDGALGADQSNRALLHPNATYTVAIDYTVTSGNTDEQGNLDPKSVNAPLAASQSFRFKTDANPPDRLDARVMATSPADGEEGFFYKDPVRIVFSSGEVRKLYKAYERELFARVKAASGNHPPTSSGLGAGLFALATDPAASFSKLATLAMSPFEDAIRDKLKGSCIDVTIDNSRHELLTVNLVLAPSTGYVFDLEAWAKNSAPQPSTYPLFRRSFRTSRYPDAGALAADLRTRPTYHRYLKNGAALSGVAGVLASGDFETSLRQAGWDDFRRDSTPRTTVIWTGPAGSPAQPIAVFIESAEATWRERQVPIKQTKDGVTAYVYGIQPWLDVVDASDPQTVARLARSSDGARTLAILKPNMAGRHIILQLRRTPHPIFEGDGAPAANTLADIVLAAPWEANA